MKFLKLFFLTFLISTGFLHAQPDYRPGYVIENTGDTIYGEIDYRGDWISGRICRFKTTNYAIEQYTPYDIKAYRFIEGKYYVSEVVGGKRVFLEYLIKGMVNIYYLRDENGDHYYLDKENVRLTEIPFEEGIRILDERMVFYRSKKHYGVLNYYMQDAPEFQSRIEAVQIPDHNSLIKLAEDYHNMVCEGDRCIIYEKQLPFISVNLETVFGIVNFENQKYIKDQNYFLTGVIANIRMPRINEKIYLKTGYLYSRIDSLGGGEVSYKQIPFHFGYIAPQTYRVRPMCSIGILTPSYSAGVAIKMNDRINLGIEAWANFESYIVPWVPDYLNNYTVLGFLSFEL